MAPALLDSLVSEMLPLDRVEAQAAVELPAAQSHAIDAHHTPLGAMVERAGFEQVRTAWQAGLGVLEDAEEFWELQATFSSFARDRIAAASQSSPERVAALRERFDERCRQATQHGGRLLYPYAASYAVARRPASRPEPGPSS